MSPAPLPALLPDYERGKAGRQNAEPQGGLRRMLTARADVFDYIERFYTAVRRHSTIGYISLVEFEKKVGLA
jgi:transposase InsO family protein